MRYNLIARYTLRVLAVFLGFTNASVQAASYWVNYASEVALADICAHDLSILSAETKADLKTARDRGKRVLGYLSLVEVNKEAHYWPELAKRKISSISENESWKTPCVDITQPAWQEFLVNDLAKKLAERGFSGFFLDTADSVHFLKEKQPQRAAEFDAALIQMIKKLRQTHPDKEIIMNRGLHVTEQIKESIDGVLLESVFRTHTPEGAYAPVDARTNRVLLEKIAQLRALGLPVYVLDYLEPGNPKVADDVAEQIRKADAIPCLTTKELQGTMTGPIRRESRRILLVYGSVVAESEVIEKFEADTFMAERMMMPLEWMGYEVEFINIGKQSPPPTLDERFCGIIFDVETQLPFGGEPFYVDWTLRHKQRGLKILFLGQYPFQQDVEKARLLKGLGVWGTYTLETTPVDVKFAKVNKDVMNYEGTLNVHPAEVDDFRAPKGSQVDLSVMCKDSAANTIICDAIFTTDWGGAILEPYATFQATAEDQASLFDPFKFLQRIFPSGSRPVPDTSTRDGRRIFYSHIDGDGFSGVSAYTGTKICGETVRDHVLTKYPFPITVSLVEASTRAWEKLQDISKREYYENAARTCLALPNVQAASHAFSHPYVWIDNDQEYIPLYATRGLELKPEANYDSQQISVEREIKGSIEYVNSLCPPGKMADLMLWSGNCRPGVNALKMCEQIGVENMNGGSTLISKRHPFLAAISSRVMLWDGYLQVHGANQNEFVYTKNWRGPFFGGFSKVTETFDLTDAPRRLKPVNIYYHFYSAATQGALAALVQVHDWCLERPLHSMTAVDYARLVRDSYYTQIYHSGHREWMLVNNGKQRTFRIEAKQGIPDISASQGITGFVRYLDWYFIHTDGSPAVRLKLTDQPKPHLYLESSQGEVSWKARSAQKLHAVVTELRPKHEWVAAGAAPGSTWKVSINGTTSQKTADDQGRLVLALSGNAEIKIEP